VLSRVHPPQIIRNSWQIVRPAYFEALGDAFAAGAPGAGATGAAVTGLVTGDGCGVGVAVASGAVDCNTECVPVTPGKESMSAINMKAAAAPIVIFDRMLAVPRGPNAVLETELENRSPAPDFPGCNRMTTINTMHAKINSAYKR
jgi:hypothetical protein